MQTGSSEGLVGIRVPATQAVESAPRGSTEHPSGSSAAGVGERAILLGARGWTGCRQPCLGTTGCIFLHTVLMLMLGTLAQVSPCSVCFTSGNLPNDTGQWAQLSPQARQSRLGNVPETVSPGCQPQPSASLSHTGLWQPSTSCHHHSDTAPRDLSGSQCSGPT